MKIYRAVIRGHFSDLDDDTAAALRARAADHHFLKSAFTAEGTLTYDEQLVAFNLRFELRPADDLPEAKVEALALAMAEARLALEGFGYRKLRVDLTDMASIWR